MFGFSGAYDCKLDNKNRLVLPARLRDEFPESYSIESDHKKKIILRRGFENNVTLYPMEIYQEIIQQFKELNRFKRSDREFRRNFLAGIREVEIDSNYRFLMPKSFMDDLQLKKDVVIVGAMDEIEIWDKKAWKKVYNPEQVDNQAEEVMK